MAFRNKIRHLYMPWQEEVRIAILAYVTWQISESLVKRDVSFMTTHQMQDTIAWRRRVLRSTMGNDTFILTGE